MYYSTLFSAFLAGSALFAVTPHAYITDQLGGSVRVLDVSNDTVQVISGFNGPRVVKVTADGTLAYVGCDDDRIRLIDTETNTILPTELSIAHPIAMALTPDGNYLYVASGNNMVSVVETTHHTIVGEIEGFDAPQDIKISPNGEFAYVSNAGNGTVSMIRTADLSISNTVGGLKTPLGLTFSVDGDYAYVADKADHSVVVIGTEEKAIVDVIYGFNYPSYITATPDKNYVFISNSGNNTISVLRNTDRLLIGSIPIPEPKSVAVTQDGQYLYVGSEVGTVFKVRVLDQTILLAISGFHNPANITVTSNNPPAETVNGCQVADNQENIYNEISWQPAPGQAVNYNIYRDPALSQLISSVDADVLNYRHQHLQEGQTYSYYVVANYANGFSSTIGSVEITPSRVCRGQ